MTITFYINSSIGQSDKVGINTTDPEETLHVIGDIILLESPAGTKKILLRTSGADGELKSLGDLYLRSEGNDIIMNHVNSDGNVAIGTATPSEKLTVVGAINIGNTTTTNDGSIRYTPMGGFEGYDGEWKSLSDGSGGHWILDTDQSTIRYEGG